MCIYIHIYIYIYIYMYLCMCMYRPYVLIYTIASIDEICSSQLVL